MGSTIRGDYAFAVTLLDYMGDKPEIPLDQGVSCPVVALDEKFYVLLFLLRGERFRERPRAFRHAQHEKRACQKQREGVDKHNDITSLGFARGLIIVFRADLSVYFGAEPQLS